MRVSQHFRFYSHSPPSNSIFDEFEKSSRRDSESVKQMKDVININADEVHEAGLNPSHTAFHLLRDLVCHPIGMAHLIGAAARGYSIMTVER